MLNDARNQKVTPVARAQLARAWLEMERLKREIRMKPKPKPIDVDLVRKKKRVPQSSLSEPMEATAAPAQRAPKEPAPKETPAALPAIPKSSEGETAPRPDKPQV